jgi:cbb3-type cytochrome oxidase subunit 1
MYVRHLTSLEFLTYLGLIVVAVASVWSLVPGRAPPARAEPFSGTEIGSHDRKLAKYFVAGGGFLVLGSLHMVAKNLPPAAEWLARAGYAGHLVRDLSNTHVMIVGGGTLIATGICWYALPRVLRRPLASNGLAQCAFWFTALGLLLFYVALVATGIAMGRLVADGWSYQAAKAHLGDWYRVPVGMGAGVMGVGYWCFAANVFLTVFQARLVRPRARTRHLGKFFVTGAAGLTIGTVQGVIQVQPKNADWLFRAGRAGEWIDPISHAHVNLVTGLTMLVAGGLFQLVPVLGGAAPSRRRANACFYTLLGGSVAFYGVTLYLGLHEGHLVVARGLTYEQAQAATPLHPWLIMAAGIAMLAGFWLLLATIVRSFWRAPGAARPFVLAGCAALIVGTLQGPVQAIPAVDELLDRAGDAGGVIVNLHAQLNMLGGLMVILIGIALPLLFGLGSLWPRRAVAVASIAVPAGMAVYYAGGIGFSVAAANGVAGGATFGAAVARLEPWQSLVLVPAALCVLVGFGAYARAAWRMTAAYRLGARLRMRAAPGAWTGSIPRRVRRRRPLSVAGYELPLGVLGFPGVGWLFAGFPVTGTILLIAGPAIAWAVIPLAFSPFGQGPLRGVGWRFEFAWLPASTLLSAALLMRAHRRRLRLMDGPPAGRARRRRSARRGRRPSRTRVAIGAGVLALVLVSLPLVPAVTGLGSHSPRYAYAGKLTREITGQFLSTRQGIVKLFAWRDPQSPYPADALRVHARDVRSLVFRAAAVDATTAYRLYDADRGRSVSLSVATRSPRSLTLAPRDPLAPGRYLLAAAHEGMFGGRDFVYLRVVPPGAATTPINAVSGGAAPTILDSLVPVAAALVATLFCILLLRSARRRPAGQKLLWAGGFALFAAAAASEALAQRAGWSGALFRAYYLCGGVLTVAFLGAGSAWLHLPRRGRDAVAGALLVATLAAAVTVAVAPVHADVLAATATGRPPPNGAIGGGAAAWAVALNSLGTLLLVGGVLRSVLRRQRVRASLWIGAGAIVLALATSMSRAGDYSLMYLGELVGISAMFYGFVLPSIERPPPPRPAPTGQSALAH